MSDGAAPGPHRRRRSARAPRRGGAGRLIGRAALFLTVGVAVLLAVLPRESPGVLPAPPVPPDATAMEMAESVLGAEALIPDIRPGLGKEIVWAGEAGVRTPLSVVYVHGFSASKAELRPVPDRVAEALGANLFLTRLAGHGRTGAALGRARSEHWMLDISEALAVGKALGERVLVIGTSAGGSLAALAAAEPAGRDRVAGYVLVSPGFGLRAAGGRVLTLPLAHWIAPLVLGEERRWTPRSEAQAAAWTTAYPSGVLASVAAVMETAYWSRYETATAPALFVLSDDDAIVDSGRIVEVAERWGAGGAEVLRLSPGPGDDPDAHVLGGDILSPGLTPVLVEAILGWAARIGIDGGPAEADGGDADPAVPAPPSTLAPAGVGGGDDGG